jgi:(1->4)-alpha-D-glucan 1-alpha-D-glucosylmutase
MRAEPRATYRIQLNSQFDFHAAAEIVPYLAELGISHLYSSPCLQAAPGSTHGYDVVDYHVSRDLGGNPAWVRFSTSYPITWRLRGAKIRGGGTYWKMA